MSEEASMTADASLQQRYTAVAITLHWVIAAAIIGMIALGWYMTGLKPGSDQTALFQLHKSIGITILLLSVARLTWRLMNPTPAALPMPHWQKLLSSFVHTSFYVLIVAMPLSGWIMASLSTAHETRFFGTVDVGASALTNLPDETRRPLGKTFEFVHSKLAWVIIVMLGLHVAGALKHQVIDKDGLLARMAPGLFGRTAGPPDHGHGVIWALGASVVVFAALTGSALMGGSPDALPIAAEASDQPPTPIEPLVQTPAIGPSVTQHPGAITASRPVAPAPVRASPAPTWAVDSKQSSILFKSAYMGRAFEGRFNNWTAAIQFDPAKPEDARIKVSIPMLDAASKKSNISTGQPYFDENVTQGDWFNVAKFPDAVFEVNEGVLKNPDGSYEATGVLTLKGQKFPLRLPFTLVISGSAAKMHGEVKLKRLELGVGRDTPSAATASDPDKEWVQNEVGLVVDIVANRK
jgi:cytochrome b561/polyisoprenoid-binding protein YceI